MPPLRSNLQRIRPMAPDIAWAVFVGLNLVAMRLLDNWATVPFLAIWVSLTVVYGFRLWRLQPTILTWAAVTLATGGIIFVQVLKGQQDADYLAEVPLIALMFLVMVWHGRRRLAATQERLTAMEQVQRISQENLRLLEQQRQFLQDASHELGTPITVALGHAELIERAATDQGVAADARVVTGELARLRRLTNRLLVLAWVIPGLGWGTAAPTMFFVEAFRTTGDERWLSAARAGARWMDAHLDESAGQWAGCGLLTGIGGWAVVLNELAAVAGDEQARGLARRVLETVAAHATADGDAVHWHDLTEMVWGTAGIGCLMLTLGADYLGPAAVDLAVRAGDWLLAQAEAAPTGIRWSLGRAYEAEHPDDQRRFPNFAHGAAGIGFFLARLAQVTGEQRFLAASLAATEWIMTTVRTDDDTCAAFHHDPGGTELFTLGWCHGPPGLGWLFRQLELSTGRGQLADLAPPRRPGRPDQRDPGPARARVLGQRRPVLRLGGGGGVLPRPARSGGRSPGTWPSRSPWWTTSSTGPSSMPRECAGRTTSSGRRSRIFRPRRPTCRELPASAPRCCACTATWPGTRGRCAGRTPRPGPRLKGGPREHGARTDRLATPGR